MKILGLLPAVVALALLASCSEPSVTEHSPPPQEESVPPPSVAATTDPGNGTDAGDATESPPPAVTPAPAPAPDDGSSIPSPPVAAFTYAADEGDPLTLVFTDASTGAASWSWDFGDGTGSTARNPSHTYAGPDTYAVTLEASNGAGSDSVTQDVPAGTVPTVAFTYSPRSPTVDQTIQFTDGSTGEVDDWHWDFGDGTVSTAQNPTHSYATAGMRTVSLKVSNPLGSETASVIVTVTMP